MTTQERDDIKSNCLLQNSKYNSSVVINKTIEGSAVSNNINEIKKKNDSFKKFDFTLFNKNNAISAEKKREYWRKNSKMHLEKSVVALDIVHDGIHWMNENKNLLNCNYTEVEPLNNKDSISFLNEKAPDNMGYSNNIKYDNCCERENSLKFGSLPNQKYELPLIPSNVITSDEKKKNSEKQSNEKNESKLPRKEGIILTRENKDNEKKLNNRILTTLEAGLDLKVIDCSPDGKYFQFNEEIGNGSLKKVYKGYDKNSKIYVAWCETKNNLFPDKIKKIREEIYILSLLSHQNILPLLNYWEYKIEGVIETNIVMITEYFDNGSLKNYITSLEFVSKSSIKTWGKQILNGLKYLHTHDPVILHRDLKCDNILYDKRSDIVKICDLGLTAFKGNSIDQSVNGTPEFMAPEMFSGKYDEGVDIYAFGMCLLEMVTGEYPYQECRKPNELIHLVTRNIKPLCLFRIKNIYDDVKIIIERCIRNRRNERWEIDEILQDQFFFDYQNYDIKIKACCYEEYLLSDETILTLEISDISNKSRKKYLESPTIISLCTFDWENEKCIEVANRLIKDFDIDIKLKHQIILQLERYIKIAKIHQKYRKIEKENEEMNNGCEEFYVDNKFKINEKKSNYGMKTDRVIPILSPAFFRILKEWKVDDKFVNDKNAQFVIVKVIKTISIDDRIFHTLFTYKKQQALIISTVKSCVPERVVKSLVNTKVINKTSSGKIVLILKAIISKIENLPTKCLPIKIRYSFEDNSIKQEQIKFIKNIKNKVNKKMLSLESISEDNLLQESFVIPAFKQNIEKEKHVIWNIFTEGKLNLSVNELKNKISYEDGNFSNEKSIIAMLFEEFTPNLFSSNPYCIKFDRDNISHHIITNNYETFFNVFNKDFGKFIKECQILDTITVMNIENKINNYYTCIKLTQKRSLTMTKSQTYTEPSIQNNTNNNNNVNIENNIKKTLKKAAPKNFKISKVYLENDGNLEANSRQRSITVCAPSTIEISQQLDIINKKSFDEKAKILSIENDINNEENLDTFDETFSTFRTRRKSFIHDNIYDFKITKDDLINEYQFFADTKTPDYSKNKKENTLDKHFVKSPTIDISHFNELNDKKICINDTTTLNSFSNKLNEREKKDSKITTLSENKPENNIDTSHIIINDEPKEHTFSVIKLQRNTSITEQFEDKSFYEEKCTIAKNKILYKANSLKSECNFVDEETIFKKKKVLEFSKRLAELLNNEEVTQNNPSINSIEDNNFNDNKKNINVSEKKFI
ncbi:WNK homolog [Strongyloides ratti]|uniref:WNK homolog n=1 Tax=Strongyloides ratti TaxID=34506 RepID=A0A090KWR3_STRRB|nr:WNK homolog [Strongyloides ratti]CEF59672.1 WNK homolog [Strongyloides ratti]